MKLSIITVSFNTRELLERLLRSVQCHPPPVSFEQIVVDNGSRDKSAEIIAEQFPEVHLICNQENRGFAAANNQALQIAKGENILFLNSDTELLPGSLDPLIRHLDGHPQVGIVGPTEQFRDGQAYPTICPFPGLGTVFFNHTGLRSRFNQNAWINPYQVLWGRAQTTGDAIAVDWLSGAGLMVRRKVLEQIGFFDEKYFFYMEETDLCTRAWAGGWQVVFVPTARIIHHGGQSEGTVRGGLLTLSGTFSELRYFEKQRSVPELYLLKGLLFAEFLLKRLLTPGQDPRRWAYREVLRAIVGLRQSQITRDDLCHR